MSESWLQEYTLLAFRIDRAVQTAYQCPFVEAYYGPPAWRSQAESETSLNISELVRQTINLADRLPLLGFAANRAIYLSKHIKAMEVICRKLSGEHFSLEQEANYCLDINPIWTPEARFEQAHALYEAVLPGTGSIANRLQAYRTAIAFPTDQMHLLTHFVNLAFAEARKRTYDLIALPKDESIDIHYLPDWEYEAAAYYKGNYQTHVTINVAATGAFLSRLFDHKICHEGYPGHHTEYVLKEQHLYQQQAYTEQALCLTLCPQRVIEEGIAQMAHTMIFAEGEAEQWLVEHVYSSLHQEVDPLALLRSRQASEMLEGVWHNAAILLDEGRSEQEVAHYFTTYMLTPPDQAAQRVTHLKHPIWGRNELTYASGKQLMQPWLQDTNRIAVFHRFLTEQWTPSQLEGNT